MNGKVKFFNESKGFGFITGEDDKEYFVHISGITGAIDKEDDVTFDVEQGDRGPKAVNVKKAEANAETEAEAAE
ncbi:MAG: cold-shock protein [Candidatus Woesearchaeota archaeon]